MNTSMLRARARENLQDNWGISIGVAAIAALLGGMMAGVTFFPEISQDTQIVFLQKLNQILNEGIRIGRFTFGFRSGMLGLAGFILGGVNRAWVCSVSSEAARWKATGLARPVLPV